MLASGAAMDLRLGRTLDRRRDFHASGSLTLNGQQFSDFNFTWTAGFGPGSYDLIDAGSISGSLGEHQRHDRRLPGNARRARQRPRAERRAGTFDAGTAWGRRRGADGLGLAAAGADWG